MDPVIHRVYAGANKPLTFLGIDRRLWALGVIIAFVDYGLFALPYGLAAAIVSFLVIWLVSLYLTRRDPQFVSLFLAIHRSGDKYMRRALDARRGRILRLPKLTGEPPR